MKTQLEKEILDKMSKNSNNWKGPFYVNHKDPRLLVPKYHPLMGWTFNFASPYSYLFLVFLIIFIIAILFLK